MRAQNVNQMSPLRAEPLSLLLPSPLLLTKSM